MLRATLGRFGYSVECSLMSGANCWSLDSALGLRGISASAQSYAPKKAETAAEPSKTSKPSKKSTIKRAPQPFPLFLKHNWAEMKAEMPAGSRSQEIMKAAAAKYKALATGDKEMYIFEAKRLAEAVVQERDELKAKKGGGKVASPYAKYVGANYKMVKETLPAGAVFTDVVKALKDKWTAMSYEDKNEYRR